ncbi:MAG TPA: hypothetical protein VFJ49_12935, partial [Methyloceanibacter sp.]|nr:hypothetical protein [Methyloceanibacter sp.]
YLRFGPTSIGGGDGIGGGGGGGGAGCTTGGGGMGTGVITGTGNEHAAADGERALRRVDGDAPLVLGELTLPRSA